MRVAPAIFSAMNKTTSLLLLCFLASLAGRAQPTSTSSLSGVVQEKERNGTPPRISGTPGGVPVFSLKDWKEWIIEKEGFAITTPIYPAQRTRAVKNGQIEFDWREFTVVSSTGRYEVRITDGAGRRRETNEVVKQRLELSSQGILQDPEYSDASREFLEVGGYPAVDVKYKFAKGVGLGWIRMTMVDGRIYQLNVEVPAKSGWPKEAALFVNSFRLLNNAGLHSEAVASETIYQATVNLQPKIIFKPTAKYPDSAREKGVEGVVVLSAVFTTQGKVTDIRILRELPYGLTESAVQAATGIKFKPALKDGQPVSVRMQLEYGFSRMQ